MTSKASRRQKFSLYHAGAEEGHRQWLVPYADAFIGCQRLLDVGCGPGTFLDLLRERGVPGLGIDFDAEMVALCREKGLSAQVADAQTIGSFRSEFDGVHAGHLIEHMPGEQMVAFLESCYDALVPGGILLVRTPNWENEQVRNGGFWLDHTHVRPYPMPLLTRIFEDLGFDVISYGAEPTGWNDLYIYGQKPGRSQGVDEGQAHHVVWEGSQFVQHSLALVNRELCLQLIEQGCDLSLIPYEADQFGPEEDPRFPRLAERTRAALSAPATVHVRHQWPPCFDPPVQGAWVMIQPWEFGTIPREWVGPMTHQVDEIWVPSSFVRDCYVRSGIPAENVQVVPNGVDVVKFHPDAPPYPLKTKKHFKFLFVGGTIARKGIDILLDVYAQTFTAADDVCLVIKDMGGKSFYKGQTAEGLIAQYRALPDAPEIEYVDEMLGEAELVGLYTACDALVHPYRGEGFALPIAEAMACELPVVVTGYGACLDFCDEGTAFLIPAEEVRLETSGLPPSSNGYWLAEPDREPLALLMRGLIQHPEKTRAVARAGRRRIVERFQWHHAAGKILERMGELSRRPPRRFGAINPFRVGLAPLPVEGRRGTSFFHHPNWRSEAWREVLTTYARAFAPEEDVSLVFWLDPGQGVSEDEVAERLMQALAEDGLDPEACPDVVLVPNGLDLSGLARLFAAADWVVPHGDVRQRERAEEMGIRILHDLGRDAWQAAVGLGAGGNA
jgi:glycosyltransferase involved in cell wall biosynthesis